MLSDIMKSSIQVMNLGARDHAALLVPHSALCAEVFKRDNERCHVCGVHIPDMMEIDHLNGHAKSDKNDLKCICPFCHALKHPLWAGARKRIIPIYAPEMTQEDIHRFAWSIIGYRDSEEAGIDVNGIISDIRERHERLKSILGCDDAQSLFEAAFSARDMMDAKLSNVTFLKIDQFLRFWPAELHWEEGISTGSRLSTWSVGGFREITQIASKKVKESHDVDLVRLRGAGEAILSGALDKKEG